LGVRSAEIGYTRGVTNDNTTNDAAEQIHHVLVVIDGTTEDVLDVIEFRSFHLELFSQQFDVPTQYDPHMLDRYVVGPDDLEFLKHYLHQPIEFRFDSYGYWIEAVTR
jgi:hypothetical protein